MEREKNFQIHIVGMGPVGMFVGLKLALKFKNDKNPPPLTIYDKRDQKTIKRRDIVLALKNSTSDALLEPVQKMHQKIPLKNFHPTCKISEIEDFLLLALKKSKNVKIECCDVNLKNFIKEHENSKNLIIWCGGRFSLPDETREMAGLGKVHLTGSVPSLLVKYSGDYETVRNSLQMHNCGPVDVVIRPGMIWLVNLSKNLFSFLRKNPEKEILRNLKDFTDEKLEIEKKAVVSYLNFLEQIENCQILSWKALSGDFWFSEKFCSEIDPSNFIVLCGDVLMGKPFHRGTNLNTHIGHAEILTESDFVEKLKAEKVDKKNLKEIFANYHEAVETSIKNCPQYKKGEKNGAIGETGGEN